MARPAGSGHPDSAGIHTRGESLSVHHHESGSLSGEGAVFRQDECDRLTGIAPQVGNKERLVSDMLSELVFTGNVRGEDYSDGGVNGAGRIRIDARQLSVRAGGDDDGAEEKPPGFVPIIYEEGLT